MDNKLKTKIDDICQNILVYSVANEKDISTEINSKLMEWRYRLIQISREIKE